MLVFLIAGLIILIPGLFYIGLAFCSRNPKNTIAVPGVLTKRQGFKNVTIKHFTVKNLTDYIYTYEANGKQYYKGTQWVHPRKLFKRVSIVYLRGFPRIAYIDQFTAVNEWALGITLSMLGTICIVVSFVVI